MKNIFYCNNCHATNYKKIVTIKGAFSFSIYQCSNCKLLFQKPLPTEKQLKKFYEDIYNKKCDLPLAEKAFEEKDVTQEIGRIKAIEKFIKGGKLLDVGASTGFFIQEVAKRKKWQVTGIEYAKNAVNEAKEKYGIDILWGDVFSRKLPNNYFDVITMHSVLEHIPDPMKTIREVNKKLKKGGYFVFNVPNINSVEYMIFQLLHKPFPGFIYEHLYYYNPKTITEMLTKNNFTIVMITSRHYSTLRLPPRRPRIGLLTFLVKLFLEYTDSGGRLKRGNIIYVYAKKNN